MASYSDWLVRVLPRWATRGSYAGALVRGLASVWDALGQGARLAAKARHVGGDFRPSDATEQTGIERGLERYRGESVGAHEARLVDAWQVWHRAGRPASIIEHVMLAVGATATIYEEVTGAWGWAGSSHGGRFVVVLDPHPWSGMTLGSWVLGDGTLGSTATPDDVRDVRRMVRRWKSAASYPSWVVLVHAGASPSVLGLLTLGSWVLGADADQVARWPVGLELGTSWRTLSGQRLGRYRE